MNKLVSKNPILRFKLGNRIVKGKYGLLSTLNDITTRTLFPVGTAIATTIGLSRNNNRVSGRGGSASYTGGGGGGSRGGGSRGESNSTSKPITYRTQDGTVITYSNGRWTDSSGNPYTFASTKTTTVNPKTNPAVTKSVRKSAAVTKPAVVNKSSVVPKTSFYGQGIGGTVLARGNNFNGLISDDARNKLIATGKFDNNSFSSVLNFLTALNNYFANDGAGSITVDDKWGNQTQKAFDLALAKAGESHGLIFNPNVNLYNNTIETPLSTVSYGYTPAEKIQVTTPQRIYNRADVRDFIRSREKNAYGFSGAQRRALRMVLNGQGTDTDRAIVSGMGIFKNGGLISRNPINRFKSNR